MERLGFALLIAAFAIDFHLDTRARDVFSWMDPYQYYEFAVEVATGKASFAAFEIPSIFPFFVVPLVALQPSIPASLWVNFAAMLVLLASVHQLCRELGVRTPTPLVGFLVLTSPLLLGLSRTLYVEFTLTAIAAAACVFLLRFLRRPDLKTALAFGCLFGLGFMTKTTFPVFLLPPVAGVVVGRAARGRGAEAGLLLAGTLGALSLAALVHLSVFSQSLGYYWNLLRTSLPFMRLMGPPEALSWSSVAYYYGEVGRTMLFLLTPLLALALLDAWRHAAPLRWRSLATPRAVLWLWFLGPLSLLIAHPLKEPRHVAACAVPAVLLVVIGIEALPRRAARAALAVALLLAALQFGLVTAGALSMPYFVDRPLHYDAIQQAMLGTSDSRSYAKTPPALRALHWKYNQNVAVAGFPGNESLALAWQGFPGIVFDLDTLDVEETASDAIAFERFEDLYFLAAVNAYNRRCGWHGYHATLSREAVVDNADFLILNGRAGERAAERYPGHVLVDTIEREGGDIRVLRSRRVTTPYRVLYARAFLARQPTLGTNEVRVVARELLMAAVLGGDAAEVGRLLGEFDALGQTEPPVRNIYWIGGYPALLRFSQRQLSTLPGS